MRPAGIAGLGLIGASLGLALRRAGVETLGLEVHPWNRSEALRRGAVGASRPDMASLAADCDVIFLAAPPSANLEILESIARAHPRSSLILTDTGSVKSLIAARGSSLFPPGGACFVPGHPMAGGSSSGPGEARADLFQGATWYLGREAPAALLDLIGMVGARAEVLEPGAHDQRMAELSHVPQILAWAMAARWRAQGIEGAQGGPVARELARIAASDPSLWADIAHENRVPIAGALRGLADSLGSLGSDLETLDPGALRARLKELKS